MFSGGIPGKIEGAEDEETIVGSCAGARAEGDVALLVALTGASIAALVAIGGAGRDLNRSEPTREQQVRNKFGCQSRQEAAPTHLKLY